MMNKIEYFTFKITFCYEYLTSIEAYVTSPSFIDGNCSLTTTFIFDGDDLIDGHGGEMMPKNIPLPCRVEKEVKL